jgi:hypothetical protein
MLRRATVIFALGTFVVAMVLCSLFGFAFQGPLLVWSAIVALAIIFERWQYRGGDGPMRGEGWEWTGERFEDPTSHQVLEVWCHRDSGERRYLPAATTQDRPGGTNRS